MKKQLYIISLIYVCTIIPIYGADNMPKEEVSLHVSFHDGSFDGQMLKDHASYDFVGMQGDTDSKEHSIAVRKKGHAENEWEQYRYFTMCTFNQWGKLINYHNQDGASFSSGSSTKYNQEECKNLQELYNKFNETYLAQLALNRETRRAELAKAEEDLTAAENEERRAANHVDHLMHECAKLRNSLPN